MSPTLAAARAGLTRGWIELRQTFGNAQDLSNYLLPNAIFLIVMIFMRGASVPGTDFSLGARTLPSVLGAGVMFGGMVTLMMALTVEREDGTLLRAKAIPHGMVGYLVGKIVLVSGMTLVSLSILLIPGLFLFDGLLAGGVGSLLTLAWVLVLGLLATVPLGAIFGSLFSNPRNIGVIMLPIMGLVAASGVFYPINNFPHWSQSIAQVFPVYWLGLGMRSAFLPGDLAAVEIGGSWRHAETAGVLAAWAVVGLLIAPIVMRRMARKESGSAVAARRENALRRTT